VLENVLYETAAIAGMQHDFQPSDVYFARAESRGGSFPGRLAGGKCGFNCLALWQSMGDKHGQALALNGMGGNACEQGEITQARALYEASLAIERQLGQKPFSPLLNLGGIARLQGDYVTSIAYYEESLQLLREAHNLGGVAMGLNGLARVEQLIGERELALRHYKESLRLFHELDDQESIACTLDSLGTYYASEESGEGNLQLAARLFGAAEAVRKTIEVPQSQVEASSIKSYVDQAMQKVGAGAFQAAWREGNAASIDALVQKMME
jgi:tetratricopeptide (TPR) repeat protein